LDDPVGIKRDGNDTPPTHLSSRFWQRLEKDPHKKWGFFKP
jgi:hypothetical protein